MSTWLVTGASGFLGRHALAAIEADRVVAIGRRRPEGRTASEFVRADLADGKGLCRLLEILEPDVVVHAAGVTPPARPDHLYRTNVGLTCKVLAALRSTSRPARVVLAGSAAELGPVPTEALPVAEDHSGGPPLGDHYGLSKWAATRAALAMGGEGLEVIVARVFNPIGPGMPASNAFGRFAATLAAPGPDPLRLPVGDLDARRDFIDVRDVASALVALALRGRGGLVYHVGTGRSRSVGEGLERLIALSGRRVSVERPAMAAGRGPADSRADNRRLVDQTGWSPRFDFERSLADLWDEARRSFRGLGVARRVS